MHRAWRPNGPVTRRAFFAVVAVVIAGSGSASWSSDADAQLLATRIPLSPETAQAPVPLTGADFDTRVAARPLLVRNANTGAEALIRLYDQDGSLDEAALEAFRSVAGEGEKSAPLNGRVIQLVAKAAYELDANKVVIVSSFRPKNRRGRGGYHTTGHAVDFQLPGVPARTIAAHARHFGRTGVGIYTHPKTQFVHIDARDQSFHWVDASPPGRTWHEAALKDPTREARDAAWHPTDDLPRRS